MLDAYFAEYVEEVDRLLGRRDLTGAQKLLQYFEDWRANKSTSDCRGRCLAVKLGAEVSDLSEATRKSLKEGTDAISTRIAMMIDEGIADRSLSADTAAQSLAATLYQLWLGASVMVKIARRADVFDDALRSSRLLMRLPLANDASRPPCSSAGHISNAAIRGHASLPSS